MEKPRERKRFIDEVCGPRSSGAVRGCVRQWLSSPGTSHLLASADPMAMRQAELTLQDCLGEVTGPPEAATIVNAAQMAVLRRAPATPEVRALRLVVEETANELTGELRGGLAAVAEGLERLGYCRETPTAACSPRSSER